MNWLGAVLMMTLVFAVPGISAAQGVTAPPGVMGPEFPNKAYCNLYGLAPDGPGDLTYVIAVSNVTTLSETLTVISIQFPSTASNHRTFVFAPRETKLFGPGDVLCSSATCAVYVCSNTFFQAFQLDSLLFLINTSTGQIISVIRPSTFTTS